MLWEQLTANPLIQDSVVMVITLMLALSWLRIMDALAANGILEQKLSRKIIHMGTGPLFVLCWPFFSPQPTACYFAALVPLAITLQFIGIGVGWIQDPDAVQAMTRTGNPKEILKGPLFYGLVFVVCTIGFWRTSPVGMLALMMMCGEMAWRILWADGWGFTNCPLALRKAGPVLPPCLQAAFCLPLVF